MLPLNALKGKILSSFGRTFSLDPPDTIINRKRAIATVRSRRLSAHSFRSRRFSAHSEGDAILLAMRLLDLLTHLHYFPA